ncbi:hypothetical protein WJX72_004815 [[Myrmecia] bisecta]|uniref:Uncharacterized protein n=1 Tax=[Myrmecia] bisecta TaxID=41462 RepID=A0AAW1PP22_9CHLO
MISEVEDNEDVERAGPVSQNGLPIRPGVHANHVATTSQPTVEVTLLQKMTAMAVKTGPPTYTSALSLVQLALSSKVELRELNKAYPRLQDLKMLHTLGTGTFGRVRLVHHEDSGSFLALKSLKKAEIVRLKQVEHVMNERNILAKLQHPFIVSLHATYSDDARVYMLLDYVVGGELFRHLRKAGRFPPHATRFYAACIVSAIEYMHSHDIIYRDLKPENLLLDQRGYLKLTDFGFAKKIKDRTWTLCGTPEYLAPEIIQNKGHSKSVDWWSVGIILFEMLAGYPPFSDENPFGIYRKILNGRITWPRHINPPAKDLISRLLQADLTQRLGTLAEGPQGVKDHPFFAGFSWDDLLEGKLKAPIIPVVEQAGDTRNYDRYKESVDDFGSPILPPNVSAEIFRGF